MSSTKAAPLIANRKGYYYEVKAGKRYLWCACGRSQSQPFCDGSHAGTEFLPVAFKAERDEDVIFCGCKQTGTAPFCDGAHSNLPGGYLTDDPDSPENQKVSGVAAAARPGPLPAGKCVTFSYGPAGLYAPGGRRSRAAATPAPAAPVL